MQSDFLISLLARKAQVEIENAELNAELVLLDALIAKHQSGAPKGELKIMPPPKSNVKVKQTRVRGVYPAAKKAIEQLSEPFDKNQLLAQLRLEKEFADKKITDANVRNALRLLKENKLIKVESEATATTCAKYVKAA